MSLLPRSWPGVCFHSLTLCETLKTAHFGTFENFLIIFRPNSVEIEGGLESWKCSVEASIIATLESTS